VTNTGGTVNGTIALTVGQSLGGDLIIGFLQLVALCLLLIIGLIKSGAWARDILGG
jgi:hypothetical protein